LWGWGPHRCARELDGFGGYKGTPGDWSAITLEDWALTWRLAAEGVPKARMAERSSVEVRAGADETTFWSPWGG
jgi:hypothetical protein